MADRVLCVGINDYPNRDMRLRGCRNDAKAWARTLVRRFDFARDDVTMLLDADATKQRIIDELQQMIGQASSGDRLVFTNSSHGTYVPDVDGDEPRYDEALCPYDCEQELIVDDDLRAILDGLPSGARFTFVADSCHSGSVTRSLGFEPTTRRIRFADPRLMGRPVPREIAIAFARGTSVARERRPESEMSELLVTGCRDDEFSYDDKFGHRYHGAMTYHALKALEAADWKIRYADWVDDVNARLRADAFDQHPQLEGRAASKQDWVFA
jgi:hypothetical protein